MTAASDATPAAWTFSRGRPVRCANRSTSRTRSARSATGRPSRACRSSTCGESRHVRQSIGNHQNSPVGVTRVRSMRANKAKNDRSTAPSWISAGVSRRSFLTLASAAAVGAGAGGGLVFGQSSIPGNFGDPVPPETDSSVEIKYSVCLACHSACGIRCKVVDGVLVKIDGNPYHPNCLEPHLDYSTDPSVARLEVGKVCAKGQAGVQTLYNPYRIKEPLRRDGPRGSGRWKTISWDEAFNEIATKLGPSRDLATPVDPSDPGLGPVANRVVFCGGRNEHGQKEFTDRFWGKSFGTVNKRHDHTSICEASHHIGYSFITGKSKGSTDLQNCEFVLWFGSDPLAANFPFVAQSRKLINMREAGGKLAIVDPRYNVAASKADWWLPVKPGTDAALAMAIGRYIIDNSLYNAAFLQRPYDGAANPTGELNSTDATHLVKIEGGVPTSFLRADEAGIVGGTSNDYVVWSGGSAVQYDSVDTADLFPGAVTVNGFLCMTAFELYAQKTRENSISDWSAICGIDETVITAIAQELTSHGRKASVELYRGPVQNTNGTYTAMSIVCLNTLIGNYNWKGGHVFGGGHW
ncbi:MAG TPA: twin-arginine translocation signal domain-containing protein, partial [Planctomycetes bacterium]|nr:twin-arginine translocation signal domain-containing protein [Planctomycetota bacterium]